MDKEQKILKKVGNLKREAQAYRQPKESEWKENRRFYAGNQWRYSENRPVKNWCFTIVEGELPILTDTRPAPAIIPLEQEHTDNAKMLDASIQWVFENQDYQLKMTQAVKNALIDGPSWQFVDFDPEAENGEGAIVIRNIPWRFVFVDPTADDIAAANYAVVEEPIRVEELKRMFPKYADKIESAHIESQGSDSKYYVDPARWYPESGNGDEKSRYESDSMTLYCKTWLKDYSEVKISDEEVDEAIQEELDALMNAESPYIHKYQDHQAHIIALSQLHDEITIQLEQVALQQQELALQGGEMVEPAIDDMMAIIPEMINNAIEIHQIHLEDNPSAKKPKFRNGWRLVITANDNSLLLYDGAPDVEDGMIPLVPYYCYKNDDIYGISEIQNIKDAQKSFNDMDWSEYKSLRLNSNSGWIKDENSGVDASELTNDEGIVITKNPGTEVSRIPPGQVSPQLDIRKVNDRTSIESISGVNEATQGRRPTGVTAAQAIRFLQEQSVGRIRLKTRMLEEYSVPRLGKLVASRVIKYWTSERKLRVYNNGGQINYVDFTPEDVRNLKYEVKAVPGSTAGLDKESIFSLYQDLLTQGFITPKTFFSVVDIPYRQKVLEDLEQMDELQAQMEQLAMENEELKAQLLPPEEVQQQQPPLI